MLDDRRPDAAAAAGYESDAAFEARVRGGPDHGILPAWTLSPCAPTALVSCWRPRPAAPWRATGSTTVAGLGTCCGRGRPRGRAIASWPPRFRWCRTRTESAPV